MQIWIILPFLAVVVFTFALYNQKILPGELSFRQAILVSGVFFAFLISVVTEILGFFNAITANAIIVIWVFFCIVSVAITLNILKKNQWNYKRISLPKLSSADKILMVFLVAILMVIASIAWTSPPCNWDSMVSNVARIMHWIQNHNLNVFPTSIEPQFYYPPFASIAIMHLQLLSGTDYFSNFVQFICLLGCLIVVSLIAKKVSSSVSCQLFSIIVCGTIPMVILQASSTQYELVMTFFIVCFVYFCDEFIHHPTVVNSLLTGASMGLAIYTKPIAYIYLIPFALIFLISIVREFDFTNVKKSFAFWSVRILPIPTTFMVLCAPYYYRTYEYFGNFLGNSHGLITIEFSVIKLIQNAIIFSSFHFQLMNPFNNYLSQVVTFTLNSINTMFLPLSGYQYSVIIPVLNFNEDTTGNALHLLLIIFVLSTLAYYFLKKKISNNYLLAYTGGIVLSFVLLCLFLNSVGYTLRYQMPLFVLSAPIAGFVLSKMMNKKIAYAILILLLVTSLPWVLINQTKPVIGFKTFEPAYPIIGNIIGKNITEKMNSAPPEYFQSIFERDRNTQYFNSNRQARVPLMEFAKNITEQKFENVGLDIQYYSDYNYEYPLWMLLQHPTGSFPRIEHVNVDNPSRNSKYNPLIDFVPEVIYSAREGNAKLGIGEKTVFDNATYIKIKGYGEYSLFIPT